MPVVLLGCHPLPSITVGRFANTYSVHLACAGYTLQEMRQAGYAEGLKAAGYTCADARAAGFVQGLKAAGYSLADCKAPPQYKLS